MNKQIDDNPPSTRSPFCAWFNEQHGRRPYPYGKDEDLRRKINEGIAAKATLRACEIYDARFESALYAWTANAKGREEHQVRGNQSL